MSSRLIARLERIEKKLAEDEKPKIHLFYTGRDKPVPADVLAAANVRPGDLTFRFDPEDEGL